MLHVMYLYNLPPIHHVCMAHYFSSVLNYLFGVILAPPLHAHMHTHIQAEVLCSSLYGANSDFVDWRQFIVCVAQPWPHPSAQDILDAMHQFSPTPESIDTSTAESGLMKDSLSSMLSKPVWVNREQYMSTELWLTRAGPQLTGDEGEGENGEKFDRNQRLKEVHLYNTNFNAV